VLAPPSVFGLRFERGLVPCIYLRAICDKKGDFWSGKLARLRDVFYFSALASVTE